MSGVPRLRIPTLNGCRGLWVPREGWIWDMEISWPTPGQKYQHWRSCQPVIHFYCVLHWTVRFGLFQWFSLVQSLSCVQLFVTPWTAAHQASLSITNSWSLLKFMSIESVMPSSHLILCRPLLLLLSFFPSIRVFSSESALHIRGQSIGVSASTSVLPMSCQHSGWISFRMVWFDLLAVQGLSRVFSNTTVQKHQFFST